jgi:hypothetical protein
MRLDNPKVVGSTTRRMVGDEGGISLHPPKVCRQNHGVSEPQMPRVQRSVQQGRVGESLTGWQDAPPVPHSAPTLLESLPRE